MAPLAPRRRKTDNPVRRTAPLLAYLLIVAVMGLVLYTQERANKADEALRLEACQQAAVNREAVRQVYRDIAQLGRELGATPERRRFLAEVLDEFEEERLADIPPLTAENCKL